ncbi:MAG TPA: hypothetical protein VHH73_02495, partial [Verrucomicrobiae bacterium]|nr:hypothetical protein [Verrucomicrobiae bacterium]
MTAKFRLGGVIATLLLILIFVAIIRRRGPPPSFDTGNAVVTLEAVTYGKTNVCLASKPWQKTLYRLLPWQLKDWAHCTVISVAPASTNSPVFWVRVNTPPNSPSGNVPIAAFPQWIPYLVDEYGCDYAGGSVSIASTVLNPNETIWQYTLDAPAPHGKPAGICFRYVHRTGKRGQLLIPGTTLVKAPPASSAPPVQVSDDFTFKLTSLVTGLRAMPDYLFGYTNNPVFTRAVFDVTRGGNPARAWHPVSVKLTNSRGDTKTAWISGQGLLDGQLACNWEGLLDPAVGPWRLEFEFIHETGFDPEELVPVLNVPFPANGPPSRPGISVDAHGLTLKIETVRGATNAPQPPWGQRFQAFVEAS